MVGGGIAGAADSFFLARLGLHPTLLEARDHLAGLTTAQAVSCFRAQWADPAYAELVHPSITFYRRFEAETGLGAWSIGLHEQGWLFVTGAPSGAVELASFVEGHRRLGVHDSELLTGDEVRHRFPWAGPRVAAGSFRALDGWLSPDEATHGLTRASEADVHLGVTVTDILTTRGAVIGVETNRGRIACDRVVIAAGPFAKAVAATAGIHLPVQLLRRHRAHVIDDAIPPEAPMVVDIDTGVYWRPEGGGAFLGESLPEPDSPPTFTVGTDWTFPAVAVAAASRLSPFWGDVADRMTTERTSLAAGQYTCTPDGLPILGETPVKGLYLHAADNGWGIESAPGAARIVAESVAETLANNPYRLDRASIETPRTGSTTY